MNFLLRLLLKTRLPQKCRGIVKKARSTRNTKLLAGKRFTKSDTVTERKFKPHSDISLSLHPTLYGCHTPIYDWQRAMLPANR
jgi:hypothetical protein